MSYTDYLDPLFGSSGVYNLDIPVSGISRLNVTTSIKRQSSGKLIVAGYTNDGNNKLTIIRYDTSLNSIDTTFGTNGIFILSTINFVSIGQLFILPNDKMLIVGKDSNNNGCIIKINENGNLDTSFGNNGFSTPLNGILSNTKFNCLDVDINENIIIGGSASTDNSLLLIVKITSTGLLDTSFNNNGYHVSQQTNISSYLITFGFTPLELNRIAFDLNGKIVACGNTAATQELGFMVRLNVNGTRDDTFATNGIFFPGGKGGYFDIIILPDGKYLIGGYYNLSYNNHFRITRINNLGVAEVEIRDKPITNIIAKKIFLVSNKVICVGEGNNNNQIAVGRFNYFTTNTNPTLDTTYGTNGYIFSSQTNNFSNAILDNLDNNFVYISSSKANTNFDFNISRLSITKAFPTLSNFSVPFNTLGTFTLVDPSSNSDGSFNYTSSNTSVATISGNNINILTPGTSIITATQSPTSLYYSGTISATLSVTIIDPSINFTVPNNKVYSDSPFILSATSTSPAPIIYSSSNPLVATISGNTVTITGPGSTVITASQTATTNYYAKSVTATLNIGIPAFPICFPSGTPVVTDQGEIAIEKINSDKNTIRGKKIVAITKTITIENKIVCIEKNSLGPNIPSQKTFISRNHKLLYNKQMIKAKHLIGQVDGVYNKKYNGEVLYNVLLETHEKMMVNNLIVETLDPKNIVAQLYNGALSVEERNNAIITINQAANEYKNQYGKLK